MSMVNFIKEPCYLIEKLSAIAYYQCLQKTFDIGNMLFVKTFDSTKIIL
jgi:hypothetical protein